ncbi:Ebp2-domain-containing protein [Thozetella sp. PMI_491]|nr:Ebp2-domain-containing protein [Thozetella sp. PMI_491]
MKLKAKSRLQAALLNEQGKGPKILNQLEKKRAKASLKTKGKDDVDEVDQPSHDADDWEDEESDEDSANELLDVAAAEGESDEEEEDDEDEEDVDQLNLAFDSAEETSDSEVEMEKPLPRGKAKQKAAKVEDDEDDEEEDEIDLEEIEDDLDSEEEADIIPRVRTTINNHTALDAAVARLSFVSAGTPFAVHQSLLSSKKMEDAEDFDVQDDLKRELAFHAQSLEAATKARSLLLKEKIPFTRPNDYFAEMLRSNEIMDKVKAKLIEQATNKKAATEARKLRDLKKFGKQVQVAKQQERAKQKKEALEKINSLKRKRQEGGSAHLGTKEADDMFDVAVENELGASGRKNRGDKRSAGRGSFGGDREPNAKRQKKDAKYGFGGKKRLNKSGDAMSSSDLSGFRAGRMKGKGGTGGGKKTPRLGKNKRAAAARR